MRVLLFILFATLVVFGCKPNTSSTSAGETGISRDIKSMEDQVMAVHDEVMPKMKDITDLSARLRTYKSNLKPNQEGERESPEGLEEVIRALKLSEQGMWDWMKSFSDTKATLQPDQLGAFYEKELESIKKVEQDMLEAIDKAQSWLNAHPE